MGPAASLPSGSVTFVFTDIEGSTRLFRRIGDRYPVLLERHREILRAAWEAWGGYEVKTEGDAFFVAFSDPAHALEACARAQRELAAEPWPVDAPLKVRMGVHSGLAYPREDDYIAFAVHQTARVVDAGHGGQIVVSSDTSEQMGEPVSVGLASLGRYRVRDFDEPVELFQVVGPGLAESFPPLRVLPADRHNLAAPITSLVSREREIAELEQLVSSSRLVSVVGPGGLGKTRLVVEYGLRHAGDWEHGLWFVSLASVIDSALLPEAIATAVAAPIRRGDDVWSAVTDFLRDRRAVVVMDNCEHLASDVGDRVAALLGACPGMRVVATSREPLGLRGEMVLRPPPLDAERAAVELFRQRAGLSELDAQTELVVVALCKRLDGLPLAIELAAARTDVMTPSDILAKLDERQGLLASRDPSLDDRQRTLDNLIGWSYQLLIPREQAALRRLGVFAAGFDIDAATAAIADTVTPAERIPELVWSLVSKSLLTMDVGEGSTRYRMLATVRSFVRRLCEGTGELDVAGRELARHYLGRLGPQIDRLDSHLLSERQRELDNLRGLLSVQPPLGALLAEELACVVVPTAARISPLAAIDEGQRYLQVLSHPSSGRVALLVIVSALLGNAGQLNVASSMLDEADVQTQVVGVPDWLEGQIENTRGAIAIHRGQPDVAEGIARAALAGARTAGARQRLFNLLGIALLEQDKLDAAREAQSQALAASTEMDNRALSAITQNNLAEIALRAGDAATAARFQAQVLRAAMEMGSLVLLASTLIVAARLADGLEDSSAAARLQAAANVQLAGLGWVMNPSDQQLSDDVLARAAARLGASQYQAELEAGAGRPVEAAIADAQSVFARAAAQPGHA